MPPRILFLVACVFSLFLPAHALPDFHTAAAARAWAEQQERRGHFDAAGEAYEREAALRRATGDPQGAEVEQRRARRLETDLALAVPGPVPPPPPARQVGAGRGLLPRRPGRRWRQRRRL